MWCKFQDVFLCHMATNGTGGSDYYIQGEEGGVDLYGLSLPSQVTAQVQHVERKQKLSWLSTSPLPPFLFFSSTHSTSPSLFCFASFIMLIRFACQQHTAGCGKRQEEMATTMGHEWTIVILACLWCAQHAHTHLRTPKQHSRYCV